MSKKKIDEFTDDIKILVNKISSATTTSEVEKYGDMLKEAMKTLKIEPSSKTDKN